MSSTFGDSEALDAYDATDDAPVRAAVLDRAALELEANDALRRADIDRLAQTLPAALRAHVLGTLEANRG